MPYILKQRTTNSPGVITFTHNEVLWGVVNKSKKVKDYLIKTSQNNQWIYGVHIQGDCSYLKEWPLEEWQSFIMWPVSNAPFLANVPVDRILPLNCINFMPDVSMLPKQEKMFDICVISRPSKIKRIVETLYLIRQIMYDRPGLKTLIIAPDQRNIDLGDKTYTKQEAEKGFFELPKKIFSCEELENISFICSSRISFGYFPVSADLINSLLARSRFLLLMSHSEGVPRVLAESFLVGTPCIVSKSLRCGISQYLNKKNSIFIDDDIKAASRQIIEGLDNYNSYDVNKVEMQKLFCRTHNLKTLENYLSGLIISTGKSLEGRWYFGDLHRNLACHGRKHNFQFMHNKDLFFEWINKVEKLEVYDEDKVFGQEPLNDRMPIFADGSLYIRAKNSLRLLKNVSLSKFAGKIIR